MHIYLQMVWPPFHSVVQVASQALTQGESYCQEVKTAASDCGNQDLDFDRGGDSGICVLDLKMLHCRSEEWSSRWRHVALWHIYSLFASCILLGFFSPNVHISFFAWMQNVTKHSSGLSFNWSTDCNCTLREEPAVHLCGRSQILLLCTY